MSKKYKNKTCVYCVIPNSSEDGDHVVSREFFLQGKRSNLPIVPACKVCNNEKSRLEHYLTAVMPCGAQADSSENLATMVPQRLAKNNKLFLALKKGMKSLAVSRNGGPWEPEMTLPFEGEKVIQLFEFVARGLAYWHWGVYLSPKTCLVKAAFFTSPAQKIFEELLAKNARDRVKTSLGDGVFVYEGALSTECPELTVWRMSLYGVQIGGDPKVPMEKCSEAYVITAPKRMPAASDLVRLISQTG